MTKRWNRLETWLALLVVGIGLLFGAIAGLHVYMTTTATALHPDAQAAPSGVTTAPAPGWDAAVARGRELARAALSEQNLPGLSVAVGVDGELVWAEGFGWADLDTRRPVTPDTPFKIGTASIVLTSAAVGLLLEQGRLDLDREIRQDVPAFPEQQWPITLRQLMGHRAGIRGDGGDEGPLLSQRCRRPVDALPAFADQALLFEPGTAYRYSTYGWVVVSAAVEAAAKVPFLTFMRTQVFEPLGMHDTGAGTATEPMAERATSYFPRYAAEPRYGLHVMRPIDDSCFAGAGVFLSTPSDLVRFGLAIDAGRLLQPATRDLLQTSQRLPSGDESGYGLGWDHERIQLHGAETPVVGHDGEVLGGTVASLVVVRDRGMVVAVTANIAYADTAAVAAAIVEAFSR